MRKCVETVVIVVMSVVLMAVALTLMRPYGMAGVATAFTIAGVYMALMVLIVTARCCARRELITLQDPEAQVVVNDSPPPYEQVVTKPPSYRTLFQPASARSFKQSPTAINSHLGLADQLGKGVTPVSVFTIERSLDVARLVDRQALPAALPLPDSALTPKERTPRRVRFSFEADLERKEDDTNERPDGEAQETAGSSNSSSQAVRASQSTDGSSGGAS